MKLSHACNILYIQNVYVVQQIMPPGPGGGGGVLLGILGGGVPPGSSNPDPISDRYCQNLYLFSDQNGSKTIPFGAAHTYIPYIGEYPPPPGNYVGPFYSLC